MAAYVVNRALDGARYDVLATIIPIEGEFLSVRVRPSRGDLAEVILQAYDGVAGLEHALRESGVGRRASAERGAAALAEGLAELGYPSMAAFTRTVLPLEVEAWAADSQSGAHVMGELPGEDTAGPVVTAAREVVLGAREVAAHTEHLSTLVAGMGASRGRLPESLTALRRAQADLEELAALPGDAGGEAPAIGERAREVSEECGAVIADVEAVPLRRLEEAVGDLALRLAITQVLAQMIVRFSQELLARGSRGSVRSSELRLLSSALMQQLDHAESASVRAAELLQVVPELLAVCGRGIQSVRGRADGLIPQTPDPAREAAGAELAAGEAGMFTHTAQSAQSALQEAAESWDALAQHAAGLSQAITEVDVEALKRAVQRIREGVAGRHSSATR